MNLEGHNLPPGIVAAMHRGPTSTIGPRREASTIAASKTDSVERECDLHDDIEAYCKGRGWYYVHSRMDRPTTTALGVKDFIIAMPKGITGWVEVKIKGRKPTPAQMGVDMILERLGHNHAIIYSFDEFLETIDKWHAI